MLNAECNAYKYKAGQTVANRVHVVTHCLDCACAVSANELGCQHNILDGWHATKHKCSRARFDPAHKNNVAKVHGCNTEAAEQLWSRTDKLAGFCTHLGRGSYRIVLRSYCKWRNGFVRSGLKSDVSTLRSRKVAVRRGDWLTIKTVMKKPAARKKPAASCKRFLRRPASQG